MVQTGEHFCFSQYHLDLVLLNYHNELHESYSVVYLLQVDDLRRIHVARGNLTTETNLSKRSTP